MATASASTAPATTEAGPSEPATTTRAPAVSEKLVTPEGRITVAQTVVAKIAGRITRDITGVHAMGSGSSRAFGALKERIPGSSGPNVAQGVGVEVGESQAAIDLEVVVEYGVPIPELGRSIQQTIKESVERMTGLDVVEININVVDVYLNGDDQDPNATPRVS